MIIWGKGNKQPQRKNFQENAGVGGSRSWWLVPVGTCTGAPSRGLSVQGELDGSR